MSAAFITYRNRKGRYFFVLRSSNDEILLSSYTYLYRIACMQAIGKVRQASIHKQNYQEGTATNGEYFFVLREADGELLATSEFFATTAWMQFAKEAVKKEAARALLTETASL
jgi:uncharacterized protein